jgi:hypothetical protein
MENITQLTGGSKYNKDTYIGYIKEKNGGMKVIPGDVDNKIIEKRDKILGHLNLVLSGGKRLKEKNIKKYFQALGGKYIRNDICISGDNSNCKNGRNVAIGGAHKLLKLVAKKKLPVDQALQTFKGSAPKLYEKLETKIKGGYKAYNYDSDGGSSSSSSTGGNKSDYTCAISEAKTIDKIFAENLPAELDGKFVKYLDKYSNDKSGYSKNIQTLLKWFNNNPEKRKYILRDSRNRRNKKCNIPNYMFPLYYTAIQVEYNHRLHKQENCSGEGIKKCERRLKNMYLAFLNTLRYQLEKDENKKYKSETIIQELAALSCKDTVKDTRSVADYSNFMDEIYNSSMDEDSDDLSENSSVNSEEGGRTRYDRDGGRENYDRYDRDGGRENYDRYDRDGGRENYDRYDRDGGRKNYDRYDRDGGRENYDRYDRDGGYSSEYSSRGGVGKEEFNECFENIQDNLLDTEMAGNDDPVSKVQSILSHNHTCKNVRLAGIEKHLRNHHPNEKFTKNLTRAYKHPEEGGYDRYDIDGGRRRRKPKKDDDEEEPRKHRKSRRKRTSDDEEEDSSGGYYDRYDSPRRRYYPNSMHGGELGRFRNEIGRGEFTLRDQILNLEI